MTVPIAQPEPGPVGLADAARAKRAQRRFPVLCVTYLVLGLVSAASFLSDSFPTLLSQNSGGRGLIFVGGIFLAMLAVVFFLIFQRSRLRSAADVTNAATLMIVLVGGIMLAARLAVQKLLPANAWFGLVDVVALHLVACLIMPWTPRESSLPVAPLMLLWAVTFLGPGASNFEISDRVVMVIVSPIVLVPGATLAWWRTKRRQEEAERAALEGRVESLGGELSRARIIHDAMFPPPFTGNVHFEYEYQPIDEIGGDYVHIHASPETGCTTVTLLDVAGHGLTAALTVNRLYGELERIRAENMAAEPAEVMGLLNRYINLTMSRHGLFATGTCMMIDPSDGRLQWVNAGHPPCLVRHTDGRVTDLPTTTLILGVLEPDEFTPGQREIKLVPGETVIAFTDGAYEARDAGGQFFGLDRIRSIASFDPPPRSWPKFIAGAVAQHHLGHAEDDVLIAAVTLRSLRVDDNRVDVAKLTPAAVN